MNGLGPKLPDRLRAAVVSSDASLRKAMLKAWPVTRVDWNFFLTGREAAGSLLASPPDIIVCSAELPDMDGIDLVRLFKGENVYSRVPVILSYPIDQAVNQRDWSDFEADDCLIMPCPDFLIRARMEMALSRASRTLDANPLTKLPGNTSIILYTQNAIDQGLNFALGYCDVDHFKAYNDKYGFSRGDEVLMMTSRLLLNTVNAQGLPFSFVGHIGGDDYVFVVPLDAAEESCKLILTAFDDIVPCFYDAVDRSQGGIISTDRQGQVRHFPLMALSIAVVFNINNSLRHFGEASIMATNLKKKAKETAGSSYVLDRRKPQAADNTDP